MSPGVLSYLGGLLLLLVGQRLFGGESPVAMAILGLGLLGVLASVGMRASARGSATTPQQIDAHTKALVLTFVGLGALFLYGLTWDWTTTTLGRELDHERGTGDAEVGHATFGRRAIPG